MKKDYYKQNNEDQHFPILETRYILKSQEYNFKPILIKGDNLPKTLTKFELLVSWEVQSVRLRIRIRT